VIDPDVGLGGVGEEPWGYAIAGDAKAQTLRADCLAYSRPLQLYDLLGRRSAICGC
jgi:hypothetical protein